MQIDRFEEFFDPKILAKGKQYFADGLVGELLCADDHTYLAWVEGTDVYSVKIHTDADGEILEAACNCPYDWGRFCKHQAAVLYAIKDAKTRNIPIKKGTQPKDQQDLQEMLMSQSKETLVEILLSITAENRVLQRSLLLRFGSAEDEIAQSRQLVKSAMHSPDGFWEYGEVGQALQGAWTVLERAEGYIGTNCGRAIGLCLVVLPEANNLLGYCDDSNGEVGEVLSVCTRTIAKALEAGFDNLPDDQQDSIFKLVLDEACKAAYCDWSDIQVNLLEALLPCCEKSDPRTMLFRRIEHLKQDASQEKYGNYRQESLAMIQLELLLRYDNPTDSHRFIEKHLNFPRFRKAAIHQAMEKKDYSTALSLALEAMETDSAFAGRMDDWRTAAYQAYDAIGNKEKALELAEYFILNTKESFAYYAVMKNNYSSQDWPRKLLQLLKSFEAKQYPGSVYIEILLEEKYFDRLIAYCRKFARALPDLAKKFPAEYKTSVLEIYQSLILADMTHASNRSDYQRVCALLQRLGKDIDKPRMLHIGAELKAMYPRRPALHDELNKILP